MISGGNATVYISNMDRAVEFYSKTLGMKLTSRFENHWATVQAGPGLTIGLHPASPKYPAPGTKGGVTIGLEIDGPIEQVVKQLKAKGVPFDGDIIRQQAGSFANFTDPDGNTLYLWEVDPGTIAKPEPAETEMG